MNGFQKHGINHSSASSINMWADAPCAWVAKYLLGQRFKFGVAAQVGVLAEQVTVDVLLGSGYDDALKKATDKFNYDNALNVNEKERERVNDIGAMSKLLLDELKPYGIPEFSLSGQKKIEINCKGYGWELPVIGFLDLDYPQHGLIVDIKTTARMPSNMSRAHQRQAAIYEKAVGNRAVKFLYATPKKAAWMEVDDVSDVLAEIKTILNRQERFLRLGDAQELKGIVPVMADSFYWIGCENDRKELFGI